MLMKATIHLTLIDQAGPVGTFGEQKEQLHYSSFLKGGIN